MKNVLKSKTVWIAVLQGIAGVVVVLQTQYPELGYVAIGKSLVDIGLRFLTTQSVGMAA